MKNFKKIWALLLLTTATGYIQTAGEEQEYNPETSVFADNKAGETFRAEEREKELHKIEPDKQQEAEEIPLKVPANLFIAALAATAMMSIGELYGGA